MVDEKEFENFVFLKALENAVEYDSQAQSKPLIGKCVPMFPEIKKDMQHYINSIERIVEQVNQMSGEEKKEKLKEMNPDFFSEKKSKGKTQEKDPLPELKDAQNGVRVRWEPAPSGYLHIGHLFGTIFNYAFVEKYGGEFVLRFSDTNPENIDIENYNKIIEDISWLTQNNISEIYYQSDRIEIYQKYLEKLVEDDYAYVCLCRQENFKEYNDNSTPCPHRNIPLSKQIDELNKCFDGTYKQGEAVVRFKADLNNKNPALRDFPIARINTSYHSRVGDKYRVWPLMNLAVAVDDVLMNITHVIRGKDHEINMYRQNMIQKALGMKIPHYFHIGRVKFTDLILSKTELTQKIADGEYWGWDDPRVPSLVSFRKRGYKAKAFKEFVIRSGVSKRDSKISEEEFYKGLNYFNKQEIEGEAVRAFFVHNPKKLHIKNLKEFPNSKLSLLKHPDKKDWGKREFDVIDTYYIDNLDFDNLKEGDLIRLMHFANFKVEEKDEETIKVSIHSIEYDKNLNVKRSIHYVPVNDYEEAQVYMQDASKLNGIVEKVKLREENPYFQFERFGFVKYDGENEEGKKVFFFTHR